MSVMQVAKDMGRDVTERKITLDEWRDGVASGDIAEVFACGTAAVITPIGVLKDATEFIGSEDAKAGETTMAIREQLLGIQTGTVEDTTQLRLACSAGHLASDGARSRRAA